MPTSRRYGERTEVRLLRNARNRAKKKDMPFDLQLDDIVVPQFCPLTDIQLVSHEGTGGHRGPRWNSPTLDRVDPSRGYVRGNIRVISSLANSLMGSQTDPDLLAEAAMTFAQRVHQYLDKETLDADISCRHRDRQPVTKDDKGMVSRDIRRDDLPYRQLRFDFST